jgi:hypothetical protein
MLPGDQRPRRLRGGARGFLGAGLYLGIPQIVSLFMTNYNYEELKKKYSGIPVSSVLSMVETYQHTTLITAKKKKQNGPPVVCP